MQVDGAAIFVRIPRSRYDTKGHQPRRVHQPGAADGMNVAGTSHETSAPVVPAIPSMTLNAPSAPCNGGDTRVLGECSMQQEHLWEETNDQLVSHMSHNTGDRGTSLHNLGEDQLPCRQEVHRSIASTSARQHAGPPLDSTAVEPSVPLGNVPMEMGASINAFCALASVLHEPSANTTEASLVPRVHAREAIESITSQLADANSMSALEEVVKRASCHVGKGIVHHQWSTDMLKGKVKDLKKMDQFKGDKAIRFKGDKDCKIYPRKLLTSPDRVQGAHGEGGSCTVKFQDVFASVSLHGGITKVRGLWQSLCILCLSPPNIICDNSTCALLDGKNASVQVHLPEDKAPEHGSDRYIRSCACLIDLHLLTLHEAVLENQQDTSELRHVSYLHTPMNTKANLW